MSMSDCIKCWDTPCTCGFDYRYMTIEARIKLAACVLGVKPTDIEASNLSIPEKHPQINDKWNGPTTGWF